MLPAIFQQPEFLQDANKRGLLFLIGVFAGMCFYQDFEGKKKIDPFNLLFRILVTGFVVEHIPFAKGKLAYFSGLAIGFFARQLLADFEKKDHLVCKAHPG